MLTLVFWRYPLFEALSSYFLLGTERGERKLKNQKGHHHRIIHRDPLDGKKTIIVVLKATSGTRNIRTYRTVKGGD